MTSTRQKSILRGSEIFGYDEKEYPERMLQRNCRMVQGSAGRPWEDPLRAFRLNGRYLCPSKRERQAPLSRAAHCWMRTEGPGFAPAIRVVPQRSLYAFVSYEPWGQRRFVCGKAIFRMFHCLCIRKK